MTLIAALLGMLIDRFVGHLHVYRHYNHYLAYVDWVKTRLPAVMSGGVLGLLVALLPLLLLVGYLAQWLHDWPFGDLFSLLYSILVLVYCLGPRDMAADVDTYCEVCTLDDHALREHAASRLTDSETAPANVHECIARVTRAVLVRASDRLFSVLFWFVLLGPVGAVLYRASSVLYQQCRSNDAFGDWVDRLHTGLVWIPARLTALGYALSGHFDAALEGWRSAHQTHSQGAEGSDRVIAETGLGALDLRDETSPELDEYQKPVRAAMRLVWRNLTIWLVAISVMTLAGWAV